ncbi:signal transduction histidine kinase [Herbihabitans rhizosphaerae]|uniref:histidine kinase n=1 Tax=Herbihabitans rhizosphaerae TaxID=1872711 RepID=A0A4V2ERW1_9PSEU|nr:nitrate- and nitrite sensing domain-containing protein [Herbihabitans rhizosphaerae]RZS34247.1 signal transduction histidine kinase [Herbihabitans rhizosphaerae]
MTVTETPTKSSEPPPGGRTSGAKRRSRLAAITRWQDWNLSTKFLAVILVPLLFAIVLGVLEIAQQTERSSSYENIDRGVAANAELRTLTTNLQNERHESAVALASGKVAEAAGFTRVRQAVDGSWTALQKAAGRVTFAHPITSSAYNDVRTGVGSIGAVREQVNTSQIDATAAIARYGTMIRALLQFDRALGTEISDPALANEAASLHDLELIKEELYYQQTLVAVGIARRSLTPAETAALRDAQARLWQAIGDFQAVATPERRDELNRGLASQEVTTRSRLFQVAVGHLGPGLPIAPEEWNRSAQLTLVRVLSATGQIGGELKATSTAQQDDASDRAGIAAVLLLSLIVVAGGVMFFLSRHMLRSLRVLRSSALHVANAELPDAVRKIRSGRLDPSADPVVEPVPVRSKDEVGQVARAFDEVHRQALRLASDEAGLRANYSAVFVNLSRRSQGLVQRQLRLLERLERDEEDSDQLATLFQLDHLATRMRRNNENLMVLSGSDPARRNNQQPLRLAELLRAGVSEIEQYQRVVIEPGPPALVVGYASGDLVRLLAELLDNATAYSSPDTEVLMGSKRADDGSLLIEIMDRGIGMTEDDVATVNQRLAEGGSVDASTSRRMGLFVVGRLAGRHGIGVELFGGRVVSGVRAEVTVPAELVISAAGMTSTGVTPLVTDAEPLPGVERTLPGTDLPRRKANGSAVPGLAAGLTGPPGYEDLDGELAALAGQGADVPTQEPRSEEPAEELPRRVPRKAFGEAEQNGAEPPPNGRVNGTAEHTLFAPEHVNGAEPDWWDAGPPPPATGAGPAEQKNDETTPIFDEMLSAWFRDPVEPKGSESTGSAEKAKGAKRAKAAESAKSPDELFSNGYTDATGSWRFAADEGWQAVEAASQIEPSSFTEAGLPRRTPREQLLPGSVADSDSALPATAPPRDADALRNRLNRYQAGVSRARDGKSNDTNGSTPEQSTLDSEAARVWESPADDGWHAAEAASAYQPSDYTTSGLPRRNPKERLLPGSVRSAPGEDRPANRDAEELRNRLAGLQRGIDRGRRNLARHSPAGAHDKVHERESE